MKKAKLKEEKLKNIKKIMKNYINFLKNSCLYVTLLIE